MFSFKRFSEQFKIILMQNAQRQGLYLIVMSLVLIYCHFLMFNRGGGNLPLDFPAWGFIISIMTIINSTNVFSALLRTDSGIHYYMSPASIGEKYAASWLYSSLFTITIYAAVIGLVHLASMSLGNAITGLDLPYHFLKVSEMRDGFLSLMFFQSLFFLGAVAFKKNPFGKTLLTIILSSFIIGLLSSVIIGNYMYGSEWMSSANNINFSWNGSLDTINEANIPDSMRNFWYALKIIIGAIPFICWIAAYFRLKTREV